MNSKELSQAFGCDDSWVRKLTKKALLNGCNYITLSGQKVAFFELRGSVGRGGKSYRYEVIQTKSAKKISQKSSTFSAADLPGIDFSKKSFSTDEKLSLVKFIKRGSLSITAVAKTYAHLQNLKESNIYQNIYRWVRAYEKSGKSALKDNRGGAKRSKIDEVLFIASLHKSGTLESYYLRYAFLEAKKEGREFDALHPKASVTIDGFRKHFNKQRNLPHIKAILKGQDALSELEPKFKIETNYPNEVWEIDATSLDIFVKVPVIDGSANHFAKVASDEYKLERYSLVGVVDRHTGARVYKLSNSDTSYADVRLLEKAICTLGMPEIIKGDNGKNYVSNHFQDVLEELGIVYDAATAYKGSEKGFVERGFRTLQHNALFENLPGFIGHNPSQRIDIENQAAGKSLKAKNGVGTQTHLKERFMWWWEAERAIDGLINHLFSKRLKEHKALFNGYKTVENLHILLGKRHKRKISREGVYFAGSYYLSKELWKHFDIGEEVSLYEEIDDASILYAKTAGGFVKLVSEDLFSISVEEAKEIKKEYKNRVTKKIKESLKSGKKIDMDLPRVLGDLSEISPSEVRMVATNKKRSNTDDVDMVEFVEKIGGYGG